MTRPSQDALDIQEAHDLYKRSIGTPAEESARAFLEATVRRVRGKR